MATHVVKDRERPGSVVTEDDEFGSRVPPAGGNTADLLDLGLQAQSRGENEKALAFFENAASEAPNKLRPALELARTLRALGRIEEARLRCQSILENRPDCTPALLMLGFMAYGLEDYSAALEHLTAAAELKPLNANAQDKVARSLLKLGRMEEADAFCRRVLEATPDHTGINLVLAKVAEQRGDIAGAIKHLESVSAARPDDTELGLRIIQLLKRADRKEAEARCRELLERQPNLADLHDLGDLLPGDAHTPVLTNVTKQPGDFAGAITHPESVAAIKPDKAEHSLRIIRQLRRDGRNAEAEAHCRELLERQPDLPEVAHVFGLLLWKRGDFEAALEQLKGAAEQKPSDLNFQLTFARILRSANRLDESRSKFKQVLETFPDTVAAVLGLANIARAKTELAEALRLFQEAARLDPADPVIPLEMAFVLSALHRTEEAEEMMQVSETLAAGKGNDFYAQRKFENFCHAEQWDRAEKCLAYWPSLREVPPEMVFSVTRYFVERRKSDELLDFFRTRIVDAGWSAKSGVAEHVIDFVAIAARQTGRYAETLGLLDSWHGNGDALVAQLRDQLNEEIALLQAVGASDASGREPAGPISDPLRTERQALRLRVLGLEGQDRRAAADSRMALPSGQQSRDTLFYCTDADYLLAAVTSLSSLLRHNNSVLPPCRLVVWCSSDVLGFASDVLGAIAGYFGRPIEVLASSTLFSTGLRFRTKFGVFTGRLLSEAAYYRIFAATQLSWESGGGRALYVDSDTCCSEGIDRLLSFDMQGRPLAARREAADWPGTLHCSKKLGLERGEYFNSGILLFDLAHPMLQPALERSVDVALQQQQLLTNLDQCALNFGFKDQVTSLDAEFNFAVRNDRDEVLPDPTPTIVHFTAFPKPWDPRYRNRLCMLWFSEFEALAEALAPKTLKRLAASFVPRARTVHGICAAS